LVEVPQNKDDAADLIVEIGKLQRKQARNAATLAARKARLEEKAASERKAIDTKIDAIVDAIEAWAMANRDEMTQDGKTKTVALPKATEVAWYNTPAIAKISKAEDVLKYVREHKLRRFFTVETVYALNKEALNRKSNRHFAEKVPGVSFVQREVFSIKGNTITEITRNIKAAKKARPKPVK